MLLLYVFAANSMDNKDFSFPITRLAILRTMGSLHSEPLRYDLQTLRTLVINLAPDLLCVDITRDAWENDDLSGVTLEIVQALVPASELSDTVMVPIAPVAQPYDHFRPSSGIRNRLSLWFDAVLRWGQRRADSPEGIHGMAFETFCHVVCALDEMTWTRSMRSAYADHTRSLADNILAAVQRDPGRRVLVVVQCQWHHALEPLLQTKYDWLEIVDYQDL